MLAPPGGGHSVSDGPTRRHVVVSGEVQGVSFRDETRREAEQAGLAGWVRNRDDGSVEAVFEGDADAVERLVEWCRSGPSSADVDDVEVTEAEAQGESGFEVR
jgi:acylphosphatase